MNWPWRRRRRTDVAEAKRHLEQVQEQQPRVERLARELEQRRRANRFTESVREALGGR